MYMNNILQLIIILAVALGIGGITYYVFPILKAKKINLNKIFETVNSLMVLMDGFMKTMKEVFPKSKEISIMDKIFEYAHIAVRESEQLYIISEISENQRKEKAEDYVYNILKQLNIEITDQVKKIVSGAIESEVYNLGHVKTIDQKTTEKNLVAQNNKLINENAKLKNTISNIQNTVK